MRPVSPRTRQTRKSGQRGVTLIELMIAVSLTAVITVGLLFALRTSVLAYEKTSDRLRSNREQISRNQILSSELGGVMPVLSSCPNAPALPFFTGTPATLRMISSYSIGEGFRGYPQILEFRVTPSPSGGVRLIVTEHPYTGPASVNVFCGTLNGEGSPNGDGGADGGENAFSGSPPFVLADGLISCEFSYHEPIDMGAYKDTAWAPAWNTNRFPSGVRVEMKPRAAAGSGLPVVNVTAPLHTDRDIFRSYADF
jgi:prepilin-type N-terminal cleavage/methylation domain-containing protein